MNANSAEQLNPLDFLERPPTKAQARAARRAEKSAKQAVRAAQPLVAKSDTQAEYLSILKGGESVFAVGPAGTGKTYLASRIGARRLLSGDIDKIIVCRVTVSDRRHALGFLPGNLDQKLTPWLRPVIQALREEMSAQTFDKLKAEHKIEFCSFEHMRGMTFRDCMVILDEAQNATLADLKLFLTRQGENAQVVVCGDMDQVDIPDSGLSDVVDLCEDFDIADVIEFGEEDVVRSAAAKAWVKAFSRRYPRQ